jgi:hypothetical protein
MSKIYLNTAVEKDGSLTIPAFAARGLGYKPGDRVQLTLPVTRAAGGYTSDGAELNIPARLLRAAFVPAGSDISVLSASGMLIIAAASGGQQRDLTDELSCFMTELGCDPESVETAEAILPF